MAKKEKKPFSLKKEVMEWMETLVWATVAVVLVFTFLGRTAVVSGSSMLPTYHDGDRMLISSLGYSPEYGDI
ncbi:MAG: signal peptidase I, partial [Oscillospiraceae bacterium]|nr:signal peptidase I [Oscillospiraceae bacterium]